MVPPGKRMRMLDWALKGREAMQNYPRLQMLIGVLLAVQAFHTLGHLLFPAAAHTCGACCHVAKEGVGHGLGLAWWMAQPGVPDQTFGGLCVYSNVFFVMLAPFFWLRRNMPELILVGLVGIASTVYHMLQVHPAVGPLHIWTKLACVSDICLALTLTFYLAARYPRTRTRAIPAIGAATLCFLLPSLLPSGSKLAQVSYSLLHSAWHGLSALAAYVCVGGGTSHVAPVLRKPGFFSSALMRLGSLLRRSGDLAQSQGVHGKLITLSR